MNYQKQTAASSSKFVTCCFSLVDVRQQFDRRKMWDVKFYNGSRESSKFLEELLRGTHGSDLYNWTGEDL